MDLFENEQKIDNEEVQQLIQSAIQARENAYAPYSGFCVGAALRTDNGMTFTGCNVENASYGATICAERVAISKAVSEGYTQFTSIAIVGGARDEAPSAYASPCGICRQVLAEFATDNCKVYVAKSIRDYKTFSFWELYPEGFKK